MTCSFAHNVEQAVQRAVGNMLGSNSNMDRIRDTGSGHFVCFRGKAVAYHYLSTRYIVPES